MKSGSGEVGVAGAGPRKGPWRLKDIVMVPEWLDPDRPCFYSWLLLFN